MSSYYSDLVSDLYAIEKSQFEVAIQNAQSIQRISLTEFMDSVNAGLQEDGNPHLERIRDRLDNSLYLALTQAINQVKDKSQVQDFRGYISLILQCVFLSYQNKILASQLQTMSSGSYIPSPVYAQLSLLVMVVRMLSLRDDTGELPISVIELQNELESYHTTLSTFLLDLLEQGVPRCEQEADLVLGLLDLLGESFIDA
jgi:hypothetical protein